MTKRDPLLDIIAKASRLSQKLRDEGMENAAETVRQIGMLARDAFEEQRRLRDELEKAEAVEEEAGGSG